MPSFMKRRPSSNLDGSRPHDEARNSSVLGHLAQEGSSLFATIREVIYNTKIEIIAFAAAFGIIGTPLVYQSEKVKKGEIPVAYSDTPENAPPVTKALSSINNRIMHLFEANDDALAKDEEHRTFARALEDHFLPTLETQIATLDQQVRAETKGALTSLQKLTDAEKKLKPVIDALGDAWHADHNNHYRTQVYYTYDKKGSHMHTRQVYVNTTHTFTFNEASAKVAADGIMAFTAAHPDLKITETLQLAQKVSESNRQSILKTMKEKFKDKKPSDADLLQEANKWATGSNFRKYLPEVQPNYAQVVSLAPQFNGSLWSAHSVQYKTTSRSDSGPQEYQISLALRDHALSITRASEKITGGLHYAAQELPAIHKLAKEYIDLTKKTGKIDTDRLDDLRDQLMEKGVKVYNKNFENGYDVDPFSWGVVIGLGLLLTAVGAGIGTGVDHLLDKYEEKRLARKREGARYKL